MKNILGILALALLLPLVSISQTTWKSEVVTDALRGTQHTQYTLQGVYLTPPRGMDANEQAPSLILRCQADPRANHGHARGKFLQGYIYTHAVVDSGSPRVEAGDIYIHYRRDDGKVQETIWNHSTDFSSVFFDSSEFNTILFGHFMPHKEGTGPQTHKLVLEMAEFLASNVVVQFNLPEDTDVFETCGVIWHK